MAAPTQTSSDASVSSASDLFRSFIKNDKVIVLESFSTLAKKDCTAIITIDIDADCALFDGKETLFFDEDTGVIKLGIPDDGGISGDAIVPLNFYLFDTISRTNKAIRIGDFCAGENEQIVRSDDVRDLQNELGSDQGEKIPTKVRARKYIRFKTAVFNGSIESHLVAVLHSRCTEYWLAGNISITALIVGVLSTNAADNERVVRRALKYQASPKRGSMNFEVYSKYRDYLLKITK